MMDISAIMTRVKNMAGDTRRPHPGAIGRWIAALRPPTLLASATSILSGASATSQHLHWGWLGITFLGLGTLQIAANLINDYGDYKKGADGAGRLGPPRVISMGWISPQEIRRAIDYALCIELLFAIPLCFRGGLKVFMLGIVGVCGAVWYTSGSYSLAYYGLGEVAVFLLFGPGSVMGTVLVQTGGTLSVQQVLVPSIMAGLLVSAILVVNNLRDIPTDLKAGKLTIATRIGEDYTRGMYTVMVAAPYLMVILLPDIYVPKGWRFSLLTSPVALIAIHMLYSRDGRALNPCLGATAFLGFLFSLIGMLGNKL